jgi:ABC-2 type transport system ATP-binding protein
MKQRIKLAQALVHDPDLLFLDEPTNGMDPKGRDEMLELIRDIAHNKGLNLILSSHLLPDVEFACDHVVVMDKGRSRPRVRLRVEGTRRASLRTADQRRLGSLCRRVALRQVSSVTPRTRTSCASSCPDDRGAPFLFQLASQEHVQVRHLRASVPTLEDVFAKAVGEK